MSVGLLYLNKVIQSAYNMSKNKDYSRKNVRTLVMNLGVGNALFFVAGNFLRLMGTEEDKEKFTKEFLTYLSGIYLLESSMVFFGALAGYARELIVDRKNPYLTNTVNPFTSFINSLRSALNETVVADSVADIKYTKLVKDIMLITGFNIAPFVGMKDIIKSLSKDGDFDGRDVAHMFGVSKSALPEVWNKRDWLKWYDYETYKELQDYGEFLDEKMKPIKKGIKNIDVKVQHKLYKALNKSKLNQPEEFD